MIEVKTTKEVEIFKPVTISVTLNNAEEYQMFKRNIGKLANESCDSTDSDFDKLCAKIHDIL